MKMQQNESLQSDIRDAEKSLLCDENMYGIYLLSSCCLCTILCSIVTGREQEVAPLHLLEQLRLKYCETFIYNGIQDSFS